MPPPTKLTVIARTRILDALRAGLTRTAAAGTANVHISQIGRWCKINESFATDCAIAEAQAEARFTLAVTKAATDGDPKFAVEWLKRRRRDEWGDSLNLSKTDDTDLLTEARSIVDRERAGSITGGYPPGIDARVTP